MKTPRPRAPALLRTVTTHGTALSHNYRPAACAVQTAGAPDVSATHWGGGAADALSPPLPTPHARSLTRAVRTVRPVPLALQQQKCPRRRSQTVGESVGHWCGAASQPGSAAGG